jgi:hypothetical protein
MAEMDGAIGDEQATPYTLPVIANATFLGDGKNNTNFVEGDGSQGLIFRDNTGGTYFNSIFGDFTGQPGSPALTIEDVANESAQDSRKRLEAGDLKLMNNFWFDFTIGDTPEALIPQAFVREALGSNLSGNQIIDPQLRGISREMDNMLDPRPGQDSPALGAGNRDLYEDPWFTKVDYVGAFGTYNWLTGWTALSQLGYLNNNSTPTSIDDELEMVPDQIALNQNYPNPFNPTTMISFTLNRSEAVKLSVYDLTGRLIATLVDGMMPAGVTNINFSANGLASGVYIYRLETPSTSMTKRMTLLK